MQQSHRLAQRPLQFRTQYNPIVSSDIGKCLQDSKFIHVITSYEITESDDRALIDVYRVSTILINIDLDAHRFNNIILITFHLTFHFATNIYTLIIFPSNELYTHAATQRHPTVIVAKV